MRLNATRRHWNALAERDAFWAVLAESDKRGGRWKPEEFFASGEAAIAAELAWVRRHRPNLRLGRALDFGCGLGRLSQALAGQFAQVEGVDISEAMLGLARQFNRHPERVQYRHNTAPDLRLYPSGHFDYVTSDITLQHMEPRYARGYLAEFVRVCAPGGVIAFQLPDHIPPDPKERFKFSWWPPTLWTRVVRFGRRQWRQWFPPEPVMEMHAIPRTEVIAWLERSGAQVLDVQSNDAAGRHITSYRYLATPAAPA